MRRMGSQPAAPVDLKATILMVDAPPAAPA
jgi:hypothetical protein